MVNSSRKLNEIKISLICFLTWTCKGGVKNEVIVIARIRRMGEGTVFSLSVQPGPGGGYPVPSLEGGEVPHPRYGQGGTPSQVQGGIPHPRSRGYVPCPADGGVPHPRSGWGYLPSGPGMGYPPPGTGIK